MENMIREYLDGSSKAILQIDPLQISNISKLLFDLWEHDNTLYTCGNGGSAALANHIATDLTKCINTSLHLIEIKKPFKAVSLCGNPSLLTCLANDLGYASIFSEQVFTLGKDSDCLLSISGSGNSANVLDAILAAKAKRMQSIVFTGFDGGRILKEAELEYDMGLHIPIDDMQIVEDCHFVAAHCIFRSLLDRIRRKLKR